MGKFTNYQSKPVVSNLLPVGEHRVRIIEAFETDSFTSHDKTRKDKEFGWENPTDQFLIHVASVENKGSLIHRLQGQGWKKFDALTDEEIKSKKYQNIDGYACIKTKTGLARIEDEAKTLQCNRIFDRLMNAVGAPEGSGIDVLDQAIADKTEFMVVIVNDEYEGKDSLKIASFKPVKKEALVERDLEA